jgi:dihydrofolate synthase/folylpolyglutamate synthase
MTSVLPSEFAATKDYLFSLKARGIKFGIDRMRLLCASLGHPERAFPSIHIAGTNGKGSVAAMVDAIFHAAGWRTGLYTSPHLVRLGERVQVDRRALSDAEIMAFTAQLKPHAERLGAVDPDDFPSFFEFMTGAAFLHFARSKVDIGILEVGLGGRLDATNVVTPEVAVITSIGLDHCEMLGDTVEKIVVEKAGIIKPGRPVVLGRLPAGALRVAREIAAERGCAVTAVQDVFGEDVANYPTTNMECDYQRWNAATATLVARQMPAKWRLTAETVARGLQHVNWPGRWQRLTIGSKHIILDASHNTEGAMVLETNLQKLRAVTGRKPVFIAGTLGAGRAAALMPVIARHAREIHLVVPHQQRATGYAELESHIPAEFSGRIHRDTVEGVFPQLDSCAVGEPEDTIVVTGSIYLIGEVMERLQADRPNEGRLQDW